MSDERRPRNSCDFSWTTACKIAWRESRSSSFKFLFVILAVAVGVGSLTGVRGFSRAFHEMLLSQARTLMAADLSLRVFELPTPQQTAAMDALAKSGVDRTWITETVTMASRTKPAVQAAHAGVGEGRRSEEISVLWRDSFVAARSALAAP